MNHSLVYLSILLVTVSCVTVKVANTMGGDVTVKVRCTISEFNGPDNFLAGSVDPLKDGQDIQFDITAGCETTVKCTTDASNDKHATFTVAQDCEPGTLFGFFLRGDGVYLGTLGGDDIKKVQEF